MQIKTGNKKIEISSIKKVNFFGKAIGLMFSRRQKAKRLLFEFNNPTKMKIHSYFVFFPFIAIWLNKDNEVIKIKIVKPFEISKGIREKYYKLIELPMNDANSELIKDIFKISKQLT